MLAASSPQQCLLWQLLSYCSSGSIADAARSRRAGTPTHCRYPLANALHCNIYTQACRNIYVAACPPVQSVGTGLQEKGRPAPALQLPVPDTLPAGSAAHTRDELCAQVGRWDDSAVEGQPLVPDDIASLPVVREDQAGAALALRRLRRRVTGSLGSPVRVPTWQEGDLEEAQIELLRRPDGSLHEIGSGAYGKVLSERCLAI